jgi:hypothetical protein
VSCFAEVFPHDAQVVRLQVTKQAEIMAIEIPIMRILGFISRFTDRKEVASSGD